MNFPKILSDFSGEYEYLSLFYPSPIAFGNIIFPTAGHMYQAAKANNPEDFQKVLAAKTPEEVNQIGKNINRRSDWPEIKLSFMVQILTEKFKQHPELQWKLWENRYLEIVYEGDVFWGVPQNHLGNILMDIRDKDSATKLYTRRYPSVQT